MDPGFSQSVKCGESFSHGVYLPGSLGYLHVAHVALSSPAVIMEGSDVEVSLAPVKRLEPIPGDRRRKSEEAHQA